MSSWGLARRSIIRLVITIPRIMFPIYIMRTYRQASSVVYHHCSKTILMKSWHCVLTGKLTAWRQIPRQKERTKGYISRCSWKCSTSSANNCSLTSSGISSKEWICSISEGVISDEVEEGKGKVKEVGSETDLLGSVPTSLCRCLAYKGHWLYKPFHPHASTLLCTAYP